MVNLLYWNHRFKDRTFAFLNPLTHRVEVCWEIYRCREDTFIVFSFRFSVKLFPPFAYIVQFWAEVNEDFDLLTISVQLIAGSSVDSSRVFSKCNVRTTYFFHVGSTGNQFVDIESGHCNRQQTNRSQDRETSAYVIGDDECFVSFFVGCYTGSTFLGIRHGNDYFLCSFFAALIFTLLLQQTESKSCFSSSSWFRDIDDTEFLVFQIFSQFVQIIFADIVSCIDHDRSCFLFLQPSEAVRQSFDDGTGTQIATTDTGYDYYFTIVS